MMGKYDNYLKDVPKVDSDEFKTFLNENGFDFLTDYIRDDINAKPVEDDINEEKSSENNIDLKNKIHNWILNNPKTSSLMFLGGSMFILYKITIFMLAQSIYKGNVKTIKYLNSHDK